MKTARFPFREVEASDVKELLKKEFRLKSRAILKQFVEEVFVTEGLPALTFVKPPNFNEIFLDVRHPGKPVIVEGHSGTGKTTCVRKILEQLDGLAPEYLRARDAVDLHRIEEIARCRLTP